MALTYSTSLKLTLIGDGDQSGIWGQTTNTNLGTLLEQAITGVQSIVMTDANYTLTSLNGITDEARNAVLVVTGTNNGVRDIIPPLVEKLYTVVNNTTGGYAIRVIGASGTGVNIPNGTACLVYCDGSNFYAGLSGTSGNFSINGALSTTGNATIGGNASVTGNVAVTGSITGNGIGVSAINASNITSGTVATGRLATSGTANSSTYLRGDQSWSSLGTMATQDANNVAITGGTISGLSSPLPVASGGTGTNALSANHVILGNGTSNVQAIAPGTSGNVLTSNGTTWVSAKPLTVYSSGSLGWGDGTSWNSGVSGIVAFGMNFICISDVDGYVVGDVVAGASSDGDSARQTAIARVGSTLYYYVSGTPSEYASPGGDRRAPMSPTYWNIQFWVIA